MMSRPSLARGLRLLTATVVAVVGFVVLAPNASADATLNVDSTFPTSVTVGQTGLAATLILTNELTAGTPGAIPLTVTSLTFVPACGAVVLDADCPTGDGDPGVFQVSNGTGAAGSACSGESFSAVISDPATGQVTFNPPSTLTLAPSAVCTVDFTVNVLKAPVHDADSDTAGIQTAHLSAAAASEPTGLVHDAEAAGVTTVTVVLAQPGIFTSPTDATLGSPISDSATLSGGDAETGTVTFDLYAGDDSTCDTTPLFTATVAVTGDGTYPSGSFTPSSTGDYSWLATYSGDANNEPASTVCGDEVSTVTVATSLTTTPSGPAVVGGAISDTATLSGGQSPTGTISFQLYPAARCGGEGGVLFRAADTVAGNGTYSSGPFTPDAPGDYDWVVSYGGDANNARSSSLCGVETTTVDDATPTITTEASPSVGLGDNITDTATISGGFGPTGTLTFDVYAANDPNCASDPINSSTVGVSTGDGSYTSAPFTPPTVGTYHYVVDYSGDTNNDAVAGVCGTSGESAVVTVASPTLTTKASGGVTIGGTISDTATLAGGSSPTGTITFSAYGPDDDGCSAAPAFTAMAAVTGNATYSSGTFTPTTAGTYLFVASYGGDSDNAAASTECGDGSESVDVAQALPVLETTASASVPVGGAITDTAMFIDGVDPTGTITFDLFAPNDPSCDGPVFTSTVPVTGNASYTSDPFTTTDVGTYNFEASYSGDANNAPIGLSTCNASGESVTVTQATPTIVTNATTTVGLGGTISDTATISGGDDPTGMLSFSVYGPDFETCDTTPTDTFSVEVNNNGSYTSPPFTPPALGTYEWSTHYNGDPNNSFANTFCGDPNETSTVTSVLTITTTASGAVNIGGNISDTADLEGGDEPTGTITFTAFGPDDPGCDDTPAFTSTIDVTDGNGTYTSDSFTPTQPGTYLFVAAYSGDDSNSSATTACNDANESVAVSPASPTLDTSASPSVPAGGQISATATLSGGDAPTGTMTFTVFGPDDESDCSATPIFTSTQTVTDNGVYTSDSFTADEAGSYDFIASYSGDANNNPVVTGCGDEDETVTVTAASPTLTTSATTAADLGGTISDTATLSGGDNPTGTITFDVFGPDPDGCGDPAFTSTITVSDGTGNYTSDPFTPTATGTYIWQASYNGDANNNPTSAGCPDPGETSTVTAILSLTTTASPAVTIGGTISDTATLSGGDSPTGTITFSAFGPNDTSGCDDTPVFTSTSEVTDDGSYTSGTFTPSAPGTYVFEAAYSGDDSNSPVVTSCSDPGESVAVNAAIPAITTKASATVPVGGTISDAATLSGGVNPTGTITFTVFGPDDATCAGPPSFTSTTTLTSGNGTYASSPFTASAAGTYRFVSAYSGDGDNQGVTTLCNDPNESVVVQQALPVLETTASASVPVGGSINDTATFSGADNPTGTITFDLFGPDDPNCADTPVFTSNVTVTGTASYTSGSFTSTTPGTYDFEASYSGDANNAPVGLSTCGASGESVTVTEASPTVTTNAGPSDVAVGSAISDTATLTGGVGPTGTITFTLFGPGTGCDSTPIFTSTVPVNAGNNTYSSAAFTTAAPGTYNFEASYSGDTDNSAVTTACGDPNESVVVAPAAPSLTTQASAPTNFGGAIVDTATLTGGAGPTGTITFPVFGPGSGCDTDAAFTSTVTVAGNGTYTSAAFTPSAVGSYQWTASYSGDANNAPASEGCDATGESTTVLVVPTITTTASAPVALGGAISDTATLSGGAKPTGAITFQVYELGDDSGCDTDAAFTSTVTVDGNGAYDSGPFTPTEPGTYQWVASYSGDDHNGPVSGACDDPDESVDVTVTTPNITTVASPGVSLGGSVTDVATVASGTAPTGTITFNLYGPDDSECSNAPVFTSMTAVSGDGQYGSGPFTPAAPGTYRFVASYSGDALNGAVTTGCDDESENVVVGPASPAVTTHASGSVMVGGTISDTATLAGGATPTGTITFTAFGPDDGDCTGTARFTSTVTVTGDGSYPSGPFTAILPGTYRFMASYSGDTDNNGVVTSCSDPNETVAVAAVPPTTTTTTSTTTTLPATTTTSTSTSTTTTPPTTTPRTTTTTRPPPATTATTAPATTTTSTTSTTSTTTPTTTTPTTTPPPTAALKLDRISTPPGGPAVAVGHGCVPNSPVTLSIGTMAIGKTVAGPDGAFTANLQLNVPVGHYTITAQCGVTLTAGIDVVLSSQASPPTATTAILLILFLVIVLLASNQLSTR